MNVAVIYLRIVKKSDPNFPVLKNYEESTRRFLETYKKHPAGYNHKLVVVNCGGYRPDDLMDTIATSQMTAIGDGYDNGTYQEVNCALIGMDLIVAMNTHVYFHSDNWLAPIAQAAKKYGPGVYGPSASYELHPHLRSPCVAYHPRIMAEYPYDCRSRGDCCLFEHGPDNFSIWSFRRRYPTVLVTADGKAWPKDHWRNPPNIFRRGDQSNCLIWDRHTEIYALADDATKVSLEKSADGK